MKIVKQKRPMYYQISGSSLVVYLARRKFNPGRPRKFNIGKKYFRGKDNEDSK